MNPATEHLIRRSFAEVVDDVLTRLAGGVVNEPILFDVKTDAYSLSRPALTVRGLTGALERGDGVPSAGNDEDLVEGNHAFRQNVDYAYDADAAAIIWLPGGARPRQGSRFFVDFTLPDADPPITDINTGSVARTLCEAVGREIATVYEEINRAWRFGFVDHAEGRALDQVVSILDVRRKTNDTAVGLVTFFRDPGVAGDITIASGTQVTTEDAAVVFETTQLRTLQRGQPRIDVPVRAAEGFPGDIGQVAASTITVMLRPLAGVASITNVEATVFGAQPESDDELRKRAKAALFALGNATLPAIESAVRQSFAKTLELWDPNGPPARRTTPGDVVLLVEAEPERFPGLDAAVNATRAAGIRSTLIARYVFVTPRLAVTIAPGLTSAGKQKLAADVVAAADALIQPLSSGDPLLGEALLSAVKQVDDVDEALILDVGVARSDISITKPETLVDAVTSFISAGTATEETRLRGDVEQLLFESRAGVPGGGRIPDRSLLLNAAGDAPATDIEIEAATFQVTATIDGDPWWIALSMTPADVTLIETAG
ncbi:MAG: baseplate J/gp47 family protein [Pseudomonadota bacterium]